MFFVFLLRSLSTRMNLLNDDFLQLADQEADEEECPKKKKKKCPIIIFSWSFSTDIWFSSSLDWAYCSCQCLFILPSHLHPSPTLSAHAGSERGCTLPLLWTRWDIFPETAHPETLRWAQLISIYIAGGGKVLFFLWIYPPTQWKIKETRSQPELYFNILR